MAGKDEGYESLKKAIKDNNIGRLYVFHGEETYLRDYYLEALRKQLVPEAFRDFNYRVFDSGAPDPSELESALDALPMMAERTMTVVKDFDFFRADEGVRERVAAILSDLPDYCCLVFFYDTVPYKPDGRMKKLAELMKSACVVDFKRREQSEMFSWIRRRFKEQGRDIDKSQSEYLMFLCGGLMTNLESEIPKIAAYAKRELVTKQDIDAVAVPSADAVVFDLTDELADGNLEGAMRVLEKLILMREEPIRLVSVLGGQMRNVYLARLMLDRGKTAWELAEILGYRSAYPAQRLMKSAGRLTADGCLRAVRLCGEADIEMKQTGADRNGILTTLLVRIYGEGAN